MVDKVSSPDRVRPLRCDEISPHVHMRVQGDGNCLFCAISRHVTGTESNHYAVRKAMVKFLQEHPSLIEYVSVEDDVPREPKKRERFFYARVRQYLKDSEMAKSGVWATDAEVFLLSNMLDVNIVVRQNFGQGRTWQCVGPTVDGLHIVHDYALYFLQHTSSGPLRLCNSSARVTYILCKYSYMEGVVADVSGCSREILLLQWRESDNGILKEVDIPFPLHPCTELRLSALQQCSYCLH